MKIFENQIRLSEGYISNSSNSNSNSNNNTSKNLNCNLKKILALIILAILVIVTIILFIRQSTRIEELNSKIKEIISHIDIKDKSSYLSLLNDKINKTEIQLFEKDKEIKSIKVNLQQKDEEAKSFNLTINNINSLMIDNINNIEIKLKQKDKELEIFSNNFNLINDKINNIDTRLNQNSDKIQEIKDLESNLSLLVDFKVKVRIKANSFIDDQLLQLCSHKPYNNDTIDDSKVKLNVFKYGYGGCIWILHQNGKFFEFALSDSSYGMNNWKIQIKDNNAFCTDITLGSIFILEEGSLNKYYKIKNTETNQYLFINKDKKRDDLSYFIDLTTNKDLATDFHFEIYREQ